MPAAELAPAPTPREWFLVWLRIGIQSFGGGVSTIALMRQELVQKSQWVTPDEFVRDFALSQLAPGINIVAMAVILGRRHGGARGVGLSLAGLLVPSALATAAITSVYAHVMQTHVVMSALRLVMPAVAGLGIATAIQTAEAPLKSSRKDGWASVFVAGLLMGVPAVLVLHWKVPTPYGLLGSALFGAAWVFGIRHFRRARH